MKYPENMKVEIITQVGSGADVFTRHLNDFLDTIDTSNIVDIRTEFSNSRLCTIILYTDGK